MAGNTRGKIKEHFAGIGRNFGWIDYHCDKLVTLIAGKKPNLTESVQALQTEMNRLDKLVQDVYSTI